MKKRHGAEQIVAMLRQADVALGKGEKVPEVCKQLGISEQTSRRYIVCFAKSYHSLELAIPKFQPRTSELSQGVNVTAWRNSGTAA